MNAGGQTVIANPPLVAQPGVIPILSNVSLVMPMDVNLTMSGNAGDTGDDDIYIEQNPMPTDKSLDSHESIRFPAFFLNPTQPPSNRASPMSGHNRPSNPSSPETKTISVYNEFGNLKRGIVRRPIGGGTLRPINEVQAHYFESDPPSLPQLFVEHQMWANLLSGFQVYLDYLEDTDDGSHNPSFTRDIGFAIGDLFFLSNVVEDQRKGEVAALRRWLDDMNQPYEIVSDGFIEGGDVLVDEPYVYVGVGQRSNMEGVLWLRSALGSSWEVIPIQLEKDVLHLDCAMAIISDNTIIWCPDLFRGGRQVFEERFDDRIRVTREDVFHMATNVLMIDPLNVVVERRHAALQEQLAERGMTVHSLGWSEMKKFGGLFRCAICPTHRDRR